MLRTESHNAMQENALEIVADGCSVSGTTRATNQDRFVCDPASGVFAVADGLGGVAGGSEASRTAIEVLARDLKSGRSAEADPRDRLPQAVAAAHRAVLDAAEANSALSGMASALVVLLVDRALSAVANVGDSRCYLFREGKLAQMSRDHSRVQLLIDRGLPPEAVYDHPMRNRLTQTIGGEFPPEPHVAQLPLRRNDRLLLCTDGLWAKARDNRIAEILARPGTPRALCEALISAALEAGGEDNVTALVVETR